MLINPFIQDRIEALQPVLDEALFLLAPPKPRGYPFILLPNERAWLMSHTNWVLNAPPSQVLSRVRESAPGIERRFLCWRLIVSRTERFLEEVLVLGAGYRKVPDWTDPRGDIYIDDKLVDVKLTWVLGLTGTKQDALYRLRSASFHAHPGQALLYFLVETWATRINLTGLATAALSWTPAWVHDGTSMGDVVVIRPDRAA